MLPSTPYRFFFSIIQSEVQEFVPIGKVINEARRGGHGIANHSDHSITVAVSNVRPHAKKRSYKRWLNHKPDVGPSGASGNITNDVSVKSPKRSDVFETVQAERIRVVNNYVQCGRVTCTKAQKRGPSSPRRGMSGVYTCSARMYSDAAAATAGLTNKDNNVVSCMHVTLR